MVINFIKIANKLFLLVKKFKNTESAQLWIFFPWWNCSLFRKHCFLLVDITDESGKEMIVNTKTLKLWEGTEKFPGCSAEWREDDIQNGLRAWIRHIEGSDYPWWGLSSDPGGAQPMEDETITTGQLSGVDGYFKLRYTDKTNQSRSSTKKTDGSSDATQQGTELMQVVSSLNQAEGTFLEGLASHGAIHGPVREFGKRLADRESRCKSVVFPSVGFVGRYSRGRPAGNCWRGKILCFSKLIRRAGHFRYLFNFSIIKSDFFHFLSS